MGIQQGEGKMEGWLYLIRSNRFGQHFSRKRYFILKENVLRSFKIKPTSQMEVNNSRTNEFIHLQKKNAFGLFSTIFLFCSFDQIDWMKIIAV